MDRNTLNRILGAIVTMLRDIGPGGAPGGAIYAALMSRVSFSQLHAVRMMLTGGGIVNVSAANIWTLTPAGESLADEINATLGRAAAV